MNTILPTKLHQTAGTGSADRPAAEPPAETCGGTSCDRTTIGTERPRNCWDPRTWKSAVRPEIAPRLDALANSNCVGIVHTTRSAAPPATPHSPTAPKPFAAGRFAVTFASRKDGAHTGFIFQTEAGPGHLAQIVPGKTEIGGGYVSLLADANNPNGGETRLGNEEIDRLLDAVYARFKAPMTDAQAQNLNSVISYASAIRYSGKGEEAVKIAHGARYVENATI